jgi:anti-anti-sigma factor
MHEQAPLRAAIVVAMPPDLDYGTADQAYDQLDAAFTVGALAVIADFTVTTYCDCAALRRLLAIKRRAAASHAELCLAVPLASPLRRILQITGLDQQFQLYPTAGHAAASTRVSASRIPHL